MSFDHIWVDYPGHVATAIENPGVQIAVRQHGHFVFHWPKDFHLGAEVNAQIANYWTPMPLGRQRAADRRPAGHRLRQRDRALGRGGWPG